MIIPLINLPSPFLTDEKTLMPLGLLYLGASAEYHGRRACVVDLAGCPDYVERAVRELSLLRPEPTAVGISITASQAKLARELASAIRDHFPGVRLVAGGAHVTHSIKASARQPERTRGLVSDLHRNYDVLVMGDGELALQAAFAADAPRIIDATLPSSEYYVGSRWLDRLPYPARHLIGASGYRYNLGHVCINESNAVNIISQRGCPFACRFCAGRMDASARLMRRPSAAHVLGEIKQLYDTYGYTDFTFYDDELNADRGLGPLLAGLIDLQARLEHQMRFRCFLRADLATHTQIRALAKAGFVVIAIGAESGSERMLTNMGKRVTKDQNTRVIEWARSAGIYTKAIISIGHPGESPETLAETERWLDAVQLEDVNFTIVSALPSSCYYDGAVRRGGVWVYTCPENGDRLYDFGVNWAETVHFINGAPSADYNPSIYTDSLSPSDLASWHRYFEAKYKAHHDAEPAAEPGTGATKPFCAVHAIH